MKLQFIKQDALDMLQKNIRINIDKYKEPTNVWIYKYFNGENPFLDFKSEVNDFELKIDMESKGKMDLENIKILYENMKMLSDTQACDERLWVGLTHSTFYNFVRERWAYDKKGMEKEDTIKSRYFISKSSRGIMRNTLSKLWWAGRFTYDSKRENPYELTEVLGNKDISTRMNDLFTSNFSRNPKVCHAFLSAIKLYEDKGTIIGGYTYRRLVQYMNLYGGMTVVDYLEEKELIDVLCNKIEKLFKDPLNTDSNVKKQLSIYSKNTTQKSKNISDKGKTATIKNKIYDLENRVVKIGDYIDIINTTTKNTKTFKMQPYHKDKRVPEVQRKCMGKSVGFKFQYENQCYEIIKIV